MGRCAVESGIFRLALVAVGNNVTVFIVALSEDLDKDLFDPLVGVRVGDATRVGVAAREGRGVRTDGETQNY